MDRVRLFTEEDITQVADLWLKVFRKRDNPAPVALKRYMRDLFFGHPWPMEGVHSLVCERDDRRIIGFIGVIPRPMSMAGRPIRAAIATQLMVDPGAHRPLAAFSLLRTLFAGPQDLTFSDGARDEICPLWGKMGGRVAHLYSLEWQRPLRPTTRATTLLAKRPWLSPIAYAARPLCRPIDALLARVPFGPLHIPPTELIAHEPSAAQLVDALACEPHALHPTYDARSLAWLLRMTAEVRGHGPLRSVALANSKGEPMGGYLYYLRPGAIAKVLHVWGPRGCVGDVLRHLYRDARECGAIAASGPMDPHCLRELSENHARFTCKSLGVLVHTRRADVLDAIGRGDAHLSRLTGEWWLRFGVDDFDEPVPPSTRAQAAKPAQSAETEDPVRRVDPLSAPPLIAPETWTGTASHPSSAAYRSSRFDS